jgi:2-methylcitrate dehydratase PrpD
MSDRFDPDAVTRKLGAHWRIMEMGIKPHSACRFCHAPIDGALEIRADADLDPMAIESIEVHGSKQLFDQTGNREPKTVMAAQLSTPFSVALALISGKTMPIDVEKGLNDPQVTGLAKRVQVIIDPTLPPTSREVAVNVKTGSAGTRSVLVKLPAGEPENPLSNEFLKEKFFTLSAPVIGRENSRQLYSRLLKVDGLDKIQLLSKRLIHPGNS